MLTNTITCGCCVHCTYVRLLGVVVQVVVNKNTPLFIGQVFKNKMHVAKLYMQGTVFGSGKCGFLNGLGIGGMRMAHTGQVLGGSTEWAYAQGNHWHRIKSLFGSLSGTLKKCLTAYIKVVPVWSTSSTCAQGIVPNTWAESGRFNIKSR